MGSFTVRLNKISSHSIQADWVTTISAVAPSVNHQLKPNRNGGYYLDPKVKVFREIVAYQARQLKMVPRDKILAVHLVFETAWITKKLEVRKADVDNLIKGTLDALVAIGIPDENIWKVTAQKLASKRSPRTHIGIMDLGNIVDYNLDGINL